MAVFHFNSIVAKRSVFYYIHIITVVLAEYSRNNEIRFDTIRL